MLSQMPTSQPQAASGLGMSDLVRFVAVVSLVLGLAGRGQCDIESPAVAMVLSPDPAIADPPGGDGGDEQRDRAQDGEQAFQGAELASFSVDLSCAIGYIGIDTRGIAGSAGSTFSNR